MMQQHRRIPWAAGGLGGLGLAPFAASALAAFQADPMAAMIGPISLVAYGAVILSFLGGARWGLEIARAPARPNAARLTASIIPALVGWLAVVGNFNSVFSLSLLIAAFWAQFGWDHAAGRTGHAPDWYPPLRLVLTVGATACLGAYLARLLGVFGA